MRARFRFRDANTRIDRGLAEPVSSSGVDHCLQYEFRDGNIDLLNALCHEPRHFIGAVRLEV